MKQTGRFRKHDEHKIENETKQKTERNHTTDKGKILK